MPKNPQDAESEMPEVPPELQSEEAAPDLEAEIPAPEGDAETAPEMSEESLPPELAGESAGNLVFTADEIPELDGMKKGDMLSLIVDDVSPDGSYSLSVQK